MILKQTIKRFVLVTCLTPISYGGILMGMNEDYDRWLEERKRKEDETQIVALGIARVIAIAAFTLLLIGLMARWL
jgi:hypothetical protein